MNGVSGIWLQFGLCALLIGLAGYQLSRYGDAIAQRTGLSGSWIGMALLATVHPCPNWLRVSLASRLPMRRIWRWAMRWVVVW